MQDILSKKQKRSIKRVRREATAEQYVFTVAQYAQWKGISERAARMEISRGLVPHRRQGRKVILIRTELEAHLRALPGVPVEQAAEKAAARVA